MNSVDTKRLISRGTLTLILSQSLSRSLTLILSLNLTHLSLSSLSLFLSEFLCHGRWGIVIETILKGKRRTKTNGGAEEEVEEAREIKTKVPWNIHYPN